MNTSIQVDINTKKTLDQLKRVYHAKSYDDTIQMLFKVKSKSMSAALAGKGRFSKEDILKGLRDKDDCL